MTKEELCKLHIEPLYETEQQKTRTRLDAIAKPLDGLGQFEKLLVQIAGITAEQPCVRRSRCRTDRWRVRDRGSELLPALPAQRSPRSCSG